eukprot:TRINITY_DN3612_c0_g2_i1.p1 TRINITY_DN3612_c0_g2~~TRINITY_DN3612_c0_g2_i1.p1  ORF type:complete len:692 (+),score=142.94 TRINITY_DN3612_c0_g2_i1:73-2076(+)
MEQGEEDRGCRGRAPYVAAGVAVLGLVMLGSLALPRRAKPSSRSRPARLPAASRQVDSAAPAAVRPRQQLRRPSAATLQPAPAPPPATRALLPPPGVPPPPAVPCTPDAGAVSHGAAVRVPVFKGGWGPQLNAESEKEPLPPAAPDELPAAAARGCQLLLPPPGRRSNRSRHVDLRRFRVDTATVLCHLVQVEGDPPARAYRVSFTIWERPAARLAAGWMFTAANQHGETVAGYVEGVDVAPLEARQGERAYRAQLLLTAGGPHRLSLVYRMESSRFWETDEGEDAFALVVDKNNKLNPGWMDKVHPHTMRTISLHNTPLYLDPLELRVPPLADPSNLPLCEDVTRIATTGRLRPTGAPWRGFFARAQWLPANCRFRDFGVPPDWSPVPGRLNMRFMGDSNFQRLQHYYEHLPGVRRQNASQELTPFLLQPNNAAMRWRFFRGVSCGDGLTPWITPEYCNQKGDSPYYSQSRCQGLFGLDARDSESNYTGYNSIFLLAGWWTVIYRRPREWPGFARGLRAVLLDCRENYPELRRRASIFWVQAMATNQTAGLGRDSAWRVLWNDRILRYDTIVQQHIGDLIDAVVPLHHITAAWHTHSRDDPHRSIYQEVFQLFLNYAIWGEKRVQQRLLGPAGGAAQGAAPPARALPPAPAPGAAAALPAASDAVP